MVERPILMSAPMVKAILSGQKVQTRRILKKQPPEGFDRHCWFNEPIYGFTNEPQPALNWWKIKCRYGIPGDILYVKESFQPLLKEGVDWRDANYKTGEGYDINYCATGGIVEFYDMATDSAFCSRITPSIFMPKWASRITLEITEIRVERLNDISEEDAIAEGLGPRQPRALFRGLWTTINGFESWDRNDYVWVIRFNRIDA